MKSSRLLWVVVLVICRAAAGLAGVRTNSTEELVLFCSQSDVNNPTLQSGLCIGFFDGFLGYEQILEAAHASPICLPQTGITNSQATKIFLKWATGHPESLHRNAAGEVLLALTAAFPCKR